MKKKMIVSLGLAAVIATSMTVGAYAATNYVKIQVLLNKALKVKVNGQLLAIKDSSGKPASPITYNGTTYLPVRSIGESMGLKVGFDSKSNTVLLGESAAKTGSTAAGLSRSHPAPIGTAVSYHVKDFMDDYQATFKVEQVVRGDQALTLLQQSYDTTVPAPGYEYLVAKMTVAVTSNTQKDAAVDINDTLFTLVSASGGDYKLSEALSPEPQVNANLYVGASHTGWAVFTVKKDDVNPLITFGRNFDGTGGVWFQTK